MPSVPDPDLVRMTLVAILKQLNQADAQGGGALEDPALELTEIESRLKELPPVGDGTVKIALAVGLLLRNGLVQTRANREYSWQRGRDVAHRYQITTEGKRYLVDALASSQRIGGGRV